MTLKTWDENVIRSMQTDSQRTLCKGEPARAGRNLCQSRCHFKSRCQGPLRLKPVSDYRGFQILTHCEFWLHHAHYGDFLLSNLKPAHTHTLQDLKIMIIMPIYKIVMPDLAFLREVDVNKMDAVSWQIAVDII